MVRLIDDLVKLVSLGDGSPRMSATPCKPDVLIRTIAERTAEKFAEKDIHLKLELGVSGEINGIDADSLDMIASNLIENAFHYTPDSGSVTITTRREPGGEFFLSVADTGVGISQEKQKTIFMKFQRSDSAVRMNSGGMGLGLYIVRNIAERHSGTVSFSSEEGRGSTFTFTGPKEMRLDSSQ
jgi:signal transduction histidine kinase